MTVLKYWNGTQWVAMPTAVANEVWTGPDAPVPVGEHRLWIDTDEPDPALVSSNAWNSTAPGPNSTNAAGWIRLVIPSAFVAQGDAGAFTRSADGLTLTVRDAGVYSLTTDAIHGDASVQSTRRLVRILKGGGTNPDDFPNVIVAGETFGVLGGIPQINVPWIGYLAEGTLLSVWSYSGEAPGPRSIYFFGIARIGAGPAGPPGPPGSGSILSTFLMEGESPAYVGMANGTNVTVNAAQNKALQWNYVPPVNVWAEVAVNIGLVNKIDAAYHYANLIPICSPAPAIGTSGGAVSYRTQHSGVQQYEPYTYTKLYALNAGVAYSMYTQFGISGGTWQYHQQPQSLFMTGKAWAR